MSIDLGLTQEQEALWQRVRELVNHHCPPAYARNLDEEGRFPDELWAEVGFRDLLGITVPTEHGGAGAGLLDLAIVCEELVRGTSALAVAYAMSAVAGGWSLTRFGTTTCHKALLEQFVRGQARFAFTPIEMENDTPTLAADSEADGGYRLHGAKLMVAGADGADQILVAARNDPTSSDTETLSLFYVSPRDRGVSITAVPQLGQRALPVCEVDLDRVRVPREALLGKPHQGGELLHELAVISRLLLAAVSTGLAQVVFEDTLTHALEPHGERPPTAEKQAVQHALATTHTRIEAARRLVYHGAWCVDAGQDESPHAAAIASYYAGGALSNATETGIRIFGASAGRLDCDMQRYLRDALPLTAAGNPDRTKDHIARGLGL